MYAKQLPKVFKYVEDVKSGKIVTGNKIKLAVTRFENDLNRKDLLFDPKKVNKVITFVSFLKHFTGKFNDKPFILEPWQCFIVANIYGFYWKATGLRRFTDAIIEIARKNGKTQIAAALALFHLIADNEADAEVIFAANAKDQAKIGFKACSKFSLKLDPKRKTLRAYRNEVKFGENTVKVVAAKADLLDGMNPSAVVKDEGHAAKTSEVSDVLKSGQAMREQPMFIDISTSGFNKTSPFYLLRCTAVEVLHGVKKDDSLFAAIWELDENDDWKDPDVWIKANPNLNITVKASFIKSEVNKARNNPSLEVGVKTKNLNIWCDSATTWVSSECIIKNSKDLNIDDYKDLDCWIGIDLASTSDITAVSTMFIIDDIPHFFNKFYLPEDSLSSHIAKEQYKIWSDQGHLILTPGNVCDYDFILRDIMETNRNNNILYVAYDSWNSTQFAINATDAGLTMEPFSQTIGNFNKSTKTFERLILSDRIVLQNSPVLRWMFNNVVIRYDWNGNIKPSKTYKGAASKIDGVISLLESLGVFLNKPNINITSFTA
jgi:phage terminase large subunit-like protein